VCSSDLGDSPKKVRIETIEGLIPGA